MFLQGGFAAPFVWLGFLQNQGCRTQLSTAIDRAKGAVPPSHSLFCFHCNGERPQNPGGHHVQLPRNFRDHQLRWQDRHVWRRWQGQPREGRQGVRKVSTGGHGLPSRPQRSHSRPLHSKSGPTGSNRVHALWPGRPGMIFPTIKQKATRARGRRQAIRAISSDRVRNARSLRPRRLSGKR